ncbi:MAG: bacterioferritin [Bdellovibrionales bacterium]
MNKEKVLECLNDILEHELSGVVRYSHYSFMIFGYNRIPIVSWFRGHATESLTHANEVGELITTLGGHPSLKIGALLETQRHTMEDILKESLEHERKQVEKYQALLNEVKDHSIHLEEYARKLIAEEELHISEVEKMLRKPA